MKSLPIGELSRLTGVKVPTIRYYEEVRLLPPPARTEGNRRQYGERAVRQLGFIRHARELGFEVEAIRELLLMSEHPKRSCAAADAIARTHLQAITSRIERLTALKAEMEAMVEACSQGRVAKCKVMDVLLHHEHCQNPHH